jgi:hypothetical protein
MSEKTISAWLVVDWRDGSTRTRKSKPKASNLGANELLAELNIDVTVPEIDVPTLSAKIDVPEPRVHAATLDALDEDDLPDWTDVADDVLEANAERVRHEATNELVTELVGATLLNASGRPDPDLVREYIREAVRAIRRGEGE